MAGPSLIDVVEAAYDLSVNDDVWMERLVASAAPTLERGHGVYAFEFDATGRRVTIGRLASSENATVSAPLVTQWHAHLPPKVAWSVYCGPRPPIATIEQRLSEATSPQLDRAMAQMCHHLGVADQLTVRATDPTRVGVAICSPLRQSENPETDAQRVWGRIATHVAAGHRLRRTLGGDTSLDGADAILDPGGRLRHATGATKTKTAREALRAAARSMDRARSRLRQKPQEAVDIWRGLVAGTWSLVDQFDSDGQRFIVARRNPPSVVDPRALTRREAQVVAYTVLGRSNKETAYALGLSPPTVAGYLRAAMRKLGIATRVELVRVLAQLPDVDG